MHRKSELKASRVKHLALVANERGQAIEALAKNMQKSALIIADYGDEIEEYALRVQHHAQCSLMYVSLQQQGLYSQNLLSQATRAYLKAVKAQVQATKLYCQAIEACIRFHKYGEC